MQTESLFKSLKLGNLGFGAAAISGDEGGYSFGAISEEDARSLVRQAYERGIKLFDTAPIYGFGESERRLGKTFRPSERERVFFISKSGVTWHQNRRVNMTNDPSVALSMLHQSLKDLRSDYIDLYMIHWPDEKIDIRATLEPLARAQEEGKIKYLGLCNSNPEELSRAQEIAEIRVIQNELNIFSRASVPFIEEVLVKEAISFMSWGTFDKGILTGRVSKKRHFDSSDCRSWAPWWKAIKKDERYEWVQKFQELLRETSHTLQSLAIGHNLSLAGVDMVLCGIRNSEQLESALAASENPAPSVVVNQALALMERPVK